jgi:hypothetical protein
VLKILRDLSIYEFVYVWFNDTLGSLVNNELERMWKWSRPNFDALSSRLPGRFEENPEKSHSVLSISRLKYEPAYEKKNSMV